MSTGAQKVGLGLAALGRPAYITSGRGDDLGGHRSMEQMRARTAQVLDAAYAAGVRYVDCARSYGVSESFLASWLAGHPALDDVTVASKWGYRYVGDWQMTAETHEQKDHSLAAFQEQVAATQHELGSHLDVYQIHSLTPDSPALADQSLLDALAELRDNGIRIGFSTSGPAQADVVRAAIEVTRGGEPLFRVVQSTWNLLEPSVGPALQEAAEAGVHVVVKEALANGRLVAGDPQTPGVHEAANVLNLPLHQAAFAAVAAQPWLGHVLSGAVTPTQVEENVAAASISLSSSQIEQLLVDAQDPREYWTARSQRAWA
ncbi:aryl-alcohol dehydrogenase-like predicted oxidoreductase [Branchiibius hedensis]|uniref:Predicted oxidoreductase n=1 Tax=Branchiibius hedensis TaxID=672460 RepID=A0A2Y8ZZS2_9MICO|nr:aldo/keto reductase [Branchiibius hedensis]PWJ26948.1 aryl-alcohol dehydrogenase-like predicted oxidoreductase [Branchiibius hedensis]SSA35759.1 Predicted oxidoreductase [Branchiibius hedensis]